MKQRWETKGKKAGLTYAERYKSMMKILP